MLFTDLDGKFKLSAHDSDLKGPLWSSGGQIAYSNMKNKFRLSYGPLCRKDHILPEMKI